MEEEFEIVVDASSGEDELRRAKLLAEVHEIRARTEELLSKQAFDASSQYNNRVIHFNDIVDYKSTQKAITQLAEMARQSHDPIEIIFHSPGGDIFSGFAMYDYIQLLRGTGIKVTTVVLGGAFSMAGILLQAGDHRVMTPRSWLMIHEAGMTGLTGTASALKDDVGLLARIEAQGNEILAERSTLSVEEIVERCHRKNWWLTSQEALEFGFIDEIRPAPAPTPIAKARKRRTSKAAA